MGKSTINGPFSIAMLNYQRLCLREIIPVKGPEFRLVNYYIDSRCEKTAEKKTKAKWMVGILRCFLLESMAFIEIKHKKVGRFYCCHTHGLFEYHSYLWCGYWYIYLIDLQYRNERCPAASAAMAIMAIKSKRPCRKRVDLRTTESCDRTLEWWFGGETI